MFQRFSGWFDSPPPHCSPDHQKCDAAGCAEKGAYRAPKSRDHLKNGVNDWHWFCLTHIRDYNASWNYYQGMNESEIDRERCHDVTWQRPSWRLGENAGSSYKVNSSDFHVKDPFGFFGSEEISAGGVSGQPSLLLTAEEEAACTLFEVGFPIDRDKIQQKYRQLVKQYHPDANPTSAESQVMIRKINEAYAVLQKKLLPC